MRHNNESVIIPGGVWYKMFVFWLLICMYHNSYDILCVECVLK
jgi:hypothetical protein